MINAQFIYLFNSGINQTLDVACLSLYKNKMTYTHLEMCIRHLIFNLFF